MLTINKSSKSVIVREGSEAVMECSVRANPRASDIQFLLNGTLIDSDQQNGKPTKQQDFEQVYTQRLKEGK